MFNFSSIAEFFENLFDNIWKEITNTAEAFFNDTIKRAEAELGTLGLKIIAEAVAAAEGKQALGSDKRAMALDAINSKLANAGIEASAPVINSALEAAVVHLQAYQQANATKAEPKEADGAAV